jgi:prefoldin subunit 1
MAGQALTVDLSTLSEEERRNILELQTRANEAKRRLIQVTSSARQKETFKRKAELTLLEVSGMPKETVTYKAVGRMFMLSAQPEVCTQLDAKIKAAGDELVALSREAQHLQETAAKLEKELLETLAAHAK